MTDIFVHEKALVETNDIGAGTRVWAFAQVMAGATVGQNCNVGGHTFIESGAVIGNNVTIKNHVCVWDGVTIEDDAFVGPHAVFTNDLYPRSPRMPEAAARYESCDHWLARTVVQRGCSIGANATILPGLLLGAYSMIAAGAVVTRDVQPYALIMGVPGQRVGTVCRCTARFFEDVPNQCPECNADLAQLTNQL